MCIDLGPLAQLGERLLCKQEVAGSIPAGSKIGNESGKNRFLFFENLYVSAKTRRPFWGDPRTVERRYNAKNENNKRLTRTGAIDRRRCDGRIWSSYQGCMVDALALEVDEGRGKLR